MADPAAPQNVLLEKDGMVKLGDLGLMIECDHNRDYVSAAFAGSARWMAPEIMMYKVGVSLSVCLSPHPK